MGFGKGCRPSLEVWFFFYRVIELHIDEDKLSALNCTPHHEDVRLNGDRAAYS